MTADLNVNESPVDGSNPQELALELAKAYSTALAISMINENDRPFSRISESVEIDHGECRRRLTIDWHLPTLAEALHSDPRMQDSATIRSFNELNPTLVLPIFIARKGRLMNHFCVEDPAGTKLYLCGQREGQERTQIMLRVFWEVVGLTPPGSSYTAGRLEELGHKYLEVPAMDADAAEARVGHVVSELRTLGLPFYPEALGRLKYVGNYMAKRHLIWLHLTARPGQAVRLSVSYRTRFSADYSPKPPKGRYQPKSIFKQLDEGARRAVGQEPYEFRIPLSMHSLCTSYHFTQTAPAGTFFLEQRFAYEQTLTMPKTHQRGTFEESLRKSEAITQGENEAGGPVAHLYARNLPSKVGDQVYAYTLLRERPPGTTALVMWLTLFASIFFWFFWRIWDGLVFDDTKGIDVAALFVALPGLASIWFSRAFKDDIRPRIPLVSRIGLLAVGMSAFYALLGVVVRRGVCSPGSVVCTPELMAVFSRDALLGVALLLSVLTVWLFARKWRFQKSYQVLQKNIIDPYSR
ncbi:hypothetical protein Amsp01_022860 [Amycolatopsis sp. NBRC 101858]|uniref:hypothetical protein n=1 Tax=Amycolatopsis sp. NBRC 101858 TaxID=3032200 RepID=UPI0024A5A695|nr:hypothetical protein [Amycolatopsis sp. NBRC 101858]GLY36262.1 hypothetical protein Amsp01_022860 [Amycolatopsis sp. NBRC 101858]